MTEAYSNAQLDRLVFYMKGDLYAVQLIIDLLYVSHLWDDLQDQDVPRTQDEINDAFLKAVGGIPTNPFYQAHQRLLASMMHSAGLMWLASVEMERGSMDDKLNCFIARGGILNVMCYCLVLTGGEPWAREQTVNFLREFGYKYTTFTEFLAEFGPEVA